MYLENLPSAYPVGGHFQQFYVCASRTILFCLNTDIRKQSLDLYSGNSTLLTKWLTHYMVSVSFHANGCVIHVLLSSLLPTSQYISEVCLCGHTLSLLTLFAWYRWNMNSSVTCQWSSKSILIFWYYYNIGTEDLGHQIRGFALQVWGPKFEFSALPKKLGIAVLACNRGTGEWRPIDLRRPKR